MLRCGGVIGRLLSAIFASRSEGPLLSYFSNYGMKFPLYATLELMERLHQIPPLLCVILLGLKGWRELYEH